MMGNQNRRRVVRDGLAASAIAAIAILVASEAPAADLKGLTIEAVETEPPNPGPETLCTLRITLRNDGEENHADGFLFKVTINGESQSVYDRHLWIYAIPPKGRVTLDLYNFWTPTSRRGFTLDVSVVEAQWLKRGKDDDRWVGPVPGLPISKSLKSGAARKPD
jgi:hypothetical protein